MVKAATPGDPGARIVKLKDTDGKTWGEIADTIGVPQGKAIFLYEQATVTPRTKITAKDEGELKRKIAAARNEGMSWGRIAARSGRSEGFCKAAFKEVTGEDARGHRIGKGGRFPDGEAPEGTPKKATGAAAKASKAVKKAAKKAPPTKKSAAKKVAKKTPIKKGVAKKVA